MNISDFIIEGRKAILRHLKETGEDNISISENEIIKANDTRLHGLTLVREGSMAGPTIYPDDLYERYQDGEEAGPLFEELAVRAEQALGFPVPEIPFTEDLKIDKIAARLSLRLIDLKDNIRFAEDRPYIDTGCGLALVAYIDTDETLTCPWKMAVTHQVMSLVGCSPEELLTRAMDNMIEMAPPVIYRLEDFTGMKAPENLLDTDDGASCGSAVTRAKARNPESVPLLLTNECAFLGASALFYPGMLSKAAIIAGGGYWVLPSSVHELILIPDSLGIDPANLVDMLSDGNRTLIEDSADKLSGRIFHYDAAGESLSVYKENPGGEADDPLYSMMA